jgi:hypothetical protein
LCKSKPKKNGRRNGRQRYLCIGCSYSFARQKRLPVSFSNFCDFYLLVKGRVNRRELLDKHNLSRPTLSVQFKLFFNQPLTAQELWELLPPKFDDKWVYGIDGKWLKRQGVFILQRNIINKVNLYWSFWPNETYGALHRNLGCLSRLLDGKKPTAAVSDWKGAVVSAVSGHFGPIPYQRCLAHVVRQAKKLLPRKSPFVCTLQLRQIAKDLIHIKTQEDITDWFERLGLWHDNYGYMLKTKTIGDGIKRKWWYTHGKLRSAWKLLTNDTEPFFKHIDHNLLPHSNNSLEGVFSQMKNKLGDHRGMKLTQQVSFLYWYFAFSRVKNKQQLKILWDYWKMKKSKF